MKFYGRSFGFRILSVAVVFFPQLCFAGLTWETQQVNLTVKSAEKTATAVFRFTNSGTTPVTITSAKADCGCTTAELAKQTYAPGEKGEIKAVFVFENRVGLQQKMIEVITDEPAGKPAQLFMVTNILEPMTCTPRLLLWNVGGDSAEKAAVISPNDANRITSIEIKAASSSEASARLEVVEAGKKYRVVVTPSSTVKPAQVTIPCVVNFSDGTNQPVSIFALIR